MKTNVFSLAKSVPIVDVINRYLPLRRHGAFYTALCPFHDDRHLGSFSVNPRTNYFKCYACETEGDGIDFVSKFCSISSRDAAVRIIQDAGLITADEAQALYSGRARKEVTCTRTIQFPQKQATRLSERKSAEHLHRVYTAFINACDPLTDAYREHLLHERQLEESELCDYFTFPGRQSVGAVWRRLRGELQRSFHVSGSAALNELLTGVPGFFVTHKGYPAFSVSRQPGIGMVIRNRDRMISGIQIRNMEEEAYAAKRKRSRYRLFSSGFADGCEDSFGYGGCFCGYVEDVLYPYNRKWCGAIALTEGRFKAVTLAKMGFLTINMHSISNWNPAGDAAQTLVQCCNASRILLVYDQEDNSAVYRSAQHLYEKLKLLAPIDIVVWDQEYGKGIDDMVNAGYASELHRVPASAYFERCGVC